MIVVRFLVGQDEERALVRLNQKLAANCDLAPAGRLGAARQAALDRRRAGDGADALGRRLRRRAAAAAGGQLQEALKEVPDVSEVTIIGGRPRQRHRRPRSGGAGGASPRSARRAAGADRERNRPTRSGSGGQRRTARRSSRRAPGCTSLDAVERVVVGTARRRAGAPCATSPTSPTAAASPTTT